MSDESARVVVWPALFPAPLAYNVRNDSKLLLPLNVRDVLKLQLPCSFYA